ncbi:MAG: hypothetical protein IJ949_01870 [Oscillospiraceae bacterium]|nr:hypothetical protein [Oscillospiraceae bacterium]
MEYIKKTDYDYIMNKYHDQSEPYEGTEDKFKRHDVIFDAQTGMDGDEIQKKVLENDSASEHMSHPVRKANAFAYILENTRISCDSRDPFPAINTVDRPLGLTVIKKWWDEVFEKIIPETEKKRAFLEDAGIVTIWPDYDHSVPDWDRVFALGFKGILDESERMRSSRTLTDKEEAFFDGIKTPILSLVTTKFLP